MVRRALSLCFWTGVLALPLHGQAQTNVCALESAGNTRQVVENGEQIILAENSFVVRCSDGEELRANSGRINKTTRDVYLLGEVFFQDSVQTLTANEATYNPDTARLWARGDVVYSNLGQGTTLRGPELEYLRATEFRPVPQMTATQRPTLTMPPAEGSDPPEPLDLTADRVEMTGDDQLFAFGDVVITRSDLTATSGEAQYNSTTEELALRTQGVILSEEFELRGDSIDARLAAGKLDFLHSRVDALLEGEDLRVSGDDLQLIFADDLLQRVVAVVREGGGTQATATSASFEIQADSLDALLVDQRLDEVYAIGNAFGASIDTTMVEPEVPTVVDPASALIAALEEGAEVDVTAGVLADAENEDPQADAPNADPADTLTGAESVDGIVIPGRASIPDDVLARDWIRGDTIIGYFVEPGVNDAEPSEPPLESEEAEGDIDPMEPLAAGEPIEESALRMEEATAPDEEEERPSVELRQLVAIGSAQSLYRMPAQDEALGPNARNVNFLVGQRIVLEVGEGELQVANVEGLQYGVYLEALAEEREGDPDAEALPDEQPEIEMPSDPEEEGA